jgi:hypothetical protein
MASHLRRAHAKLRRYAQQRMASLTKLHNPDNILGQETYKLGLDRSESQQSIAAGAGF